MPAASGEDGVSDAPVPPWVSTTRAGMAAPAAEVSEKETAAIGLLKLAVTVVDSGRELDRSTGVAVSRVGAPASVDVSPLNVTSTP